jgi:putative copper export protein
MDVVGWVAVTVVAVVVVAGVVVGLVNIPDARRYMKIRRM